MSDSNANCAYQYTVKRGDSFYLIAQRTGVKLRDLLDANPGIPPARLTVGDVLCIPFGEEVQTPAGEGNHNSCGSGSSVSCDDDSSRPDPGPSVPVPACPPNRRTVVQNNQTAADLQVKYGLSYHTLQTANPAANLEALKGGDILCIPTENTPCPVAATVTLKAGESLESLAQSCGVSVAALLRANPCLAPADFRQGAVIRLPE